MSLRVDGAWGLRFPALANGSVPLVPAPEDWPLVDVRVTVEPVAETRSGFGDRRAQYALLGGHRIEIEREPLSVALALKASTAAECIVQPHMSSAASTISIWHGRQPLHAGAFLFEGGAWVLLGGKGFGKSSTLGWLATHGHTIVTDDLLIYEDGAVFAGPRCIDLRLEAAQRLGAGRDLGIIGTRERWRIDLGPCPAVAPLRGWIFLDWAPELRIERLSATERLERLAHHRALALPWSDPAVLLELSSYPAYAWRRPNGWSSIDAAVPVLLQQLACG